MEIIKTKIKDLQIVKQKNNLDKRGSLKVIFNDKFFKIKDLNMNIILYQKKRYQRISLSNKKSANKIY